MNLSTKWKKHLTKAPFCVEIRESGELILTFFCKNQNGKKLLRADTPIKRKK